MPVDTASVPAVVPMKPPRPDSGRRVNFKTSADQSDDSQVGRVRSAKATRVFRGDVEAAADV